MKRSGKKREFVVPDAQRWQTRKKQATNPKREARASVVRFELCEFADVDPDSVGRKRYGVFAPTFGGTRLRKFENGREVDFDLGGRHVEDVVAELRAAGFIVEEIRAGTFMGPRR